MVPDGETCAICLQDYDLFPSSTDTDNEERHILCATASCSHRFGYSCLLLWAQKYNTCPTCRKETYQRNEEEERPNRSMLAELMIGEEFDTDEEETYDPWNMEGRMGRSEEFVPVGNYPRSHYPAYWSLNHAATISLDDYDTDDEDLSMEVFISVGDGDGKDYNALSSNDEEEDVNSANLAQYLQSFDIATETEDQAPEGESEWVAVALREYDMLQSSYRARVEYLNI